MKEECHFKLSIIWVPYTITRNEKDYLCEEKKTLSPDQIIKQSWIQLWIPRGIQREHKLNTKSFILYIYSNGALTSQLEAYFVNSLIEWEQEGIITKYAPSSECLFSSKVSFSAVAVVVV